MMISFIVITSLKHCNMFLFTYNNRKHGSLHYKILLKFNSVMQGKRSANIFFEVVAKQLIVNYPF